MHFNEGAPCPHTNGVDWMVIDGPSAWPGGKEILPSPSCLPDFPSPPKAATHSPSPPLCGGEIGPRLCPLLPATPPSGPRAGGGGRGSAHGAAEYRAGHRGPVNASSGSSGLASDQGPGTKFRWLSATRGRGNQAQRPASGTRGQSKILLSPRRPPWGRGGWDGVPQGNPHFGRFLPSLGMFLEKTQFPVDHGVKKILHLIVKQLLWVMGTLVFIF